jgi:hypothetical protein
MKTDIVKKTYNDLHALHRELLEGIQSFSPDALHNIVDQLHSDSKNLSRQMNQDIKLKEVTVSIDIKLRAELLDIIHKIQHSPDFLQTLGPLEHKLVPILKAIEINVKKWEPKVEKTDNDVM